MHRSFTIILVVLLVVALAIPAFAISIDSVPTSATNKPYAVIMSYNNGKFEQVVYSSQPFHVSSTSLTCDNYERYYRQVGTTEWTRSDYTTGQSWTLTSINIYYTSHDILDENGNLYMPGEPKECDGSTCPATDIDHDNICDDCGKVLAFSLRSTLLDYARTIAENNDAGYNYWAIFQIDDQYRVYVSSTPMTSPDGVIVTGTDFKYALVYELENGSFSYGSWYTGFDIDALTFVESNHTIENFLRAPLAVTVQGVTGEPMEMEIPSLYPTMKILTLCGVGCLALLIGLNLLRKKSLIFPR